MSAKFSKKNPLSYIILALKSLKNKQTVNNLEKICLQALDWTRSRIKCGWIPILGNIKTLPQLLLKKKNLREVFLSSDIAKSFTKFIF